MLRGVQGDTGVSDDRAANVAAYADPSLPIDPKLVEAIAVFVKG